MWKLQNTIIRGQLFAIMIIMVSSNLIITIRGMEEDRQYTNNSQLVRKESTFVIS